MKNEKIMQISAKLNPEIDEELILGIKKIPKRERSHFYRTAVLKHLREVDKRQ